MAATSELPQLDPITLDNEAVILDVREPNEYQAGHAPGAVSIPLGQVRDRLADIPSVEGVLPVICRSGVRSQKAAEFLAGHGIAVANVSGGTTAWAQAGKALVSETDAEPAVVAPGTAPPESV